MDAIMKKKVLQDESLKEALQSLYPDSSGRTLKNLLQAKRVSVDGKIETHGNFLVKEGQEVMVGKTPAPPLKDFEILYEDIHLVIIDKPTGLLSVPLDEGAVRNALSILREHYQTPSVFAVHRIDKNASGVLVFARSEEAKVGMDELFKSHDLTREYVALVEGRMLSSKGIWKSRLAEQSSSLKVYAVKDPEEGKEAITHYEVIRRAPKCTWMRLTLETGRKHQIRVHCKDAGHPILGDKEYSAMLNPYKRLCLHAHRIAFTHPITKEKLDIQAKPAVFMRDFLSTPAKNVETPS